MKTAGKILKALYEELDGEICCGGDFCEGTTAHSESVKKTVASSFIKLKEETLSKFKKLEQKQLMLMREDEAIPVIAWNEIQALLKSPQRRWQLKQKALGNCVRCGRKVVTKSFCEIHRKTG
jgi:hypothetical protein